MSARRSIWASSGAALAVNLAGMALGYATVVVLTQLLSQEAFGAYSYVLAVVQVATIPAMVGLPNLIVREVAGATVSGKWGEVVGLLIRGHQIAVLTAFGVGAGVLLGQALMPEWFAGLSPALFGWGVLLMPLMALTGLRSAMVRGLFHVALGSFPELVLQKGVVLALVMLLAATGWVLTAEHVLAAQVAGAVVATAFGYATFLWLWPARGQRITPVYHTWEWLKVTLPIGLSQNLHVFNAQLGLLALGAFGALDEVATLKVASQLGLVVLLCYSTLNSVLYPRVSAGLEAGDNDRIRSVLLWGARGVTGISVLLLVGLALLGPLVIPLLFGEAYRSAVAPTVIVALAHTVNAAFGFPAMLLTSARLERKVTVSFFIAAAFNVLLTPPLASAFGAVGAAWASVATTAASNAALWYAARRHLGIDTSVIGRFDR